MSRLWGKKQIYSSTVLGTLLLAVLLLAPLTGCRGKAEAHAGRYHVGGVVSGLESGEAVTLSEEESGQQQRVAANGHFSFSTAVAAGSNYRVLVVEAPSGKSCAVSNGSGRVANADVTSVRVECSAANQEPQALIVGHENTDPAVIPNEWIARVKSDLHVAYNHTSHGSQLITGMNALQSFPPFGTRYAWMDSTHGDADHLSLDDRGIPL
jgi:hypothetical protein